MQRKEKEETLEIKKFLEGEKRQSKDVEIPVDLINLQKISNVKTTKNETIKQLNKQKKNIVLLFLRNIKNKTE